MKAKLVNFFILIIGGIIIFNLTANILRLWQKRGGLSEEQQELEDLKAKNLELKTELEYVQSPEFIEKEIRDKLGWAKEGEEVWVLPPAIRENQLPIRENPEIPVWKQWLELFVEVNE